MCLYWVKEYAEEIVLKNAKNKREKLIEIDEPYNVVLLMICYKLGRAKRTCLREYQFRGRIGNLLH